MLRILTAAIGAVLVLAQTAFPAFAETWPARPIKLVVPFSPGGSTDITARVLADGLRSVLGQSVIVDNRPGAGGNIAGDVVAKAAPDGYVFLVSSATLVANISLYKHLTYDFVKDLAPVSLTNWSTNVLVVNAKLPIKSLSEFIAHVKSGKEPIVHYGTAGHGSSQHLAAAMFNHLVAGNMVHVPYKGGAPAMTALVAGEIEAIFAPLIEALPNIKSGAVRVLAVATPKASPLAPGIPVIRDTLPAYVMTSWTGILAPAKTPPDIVNKMSQAIAKTLTLPKVKKHFDEADKEPASNTPAEFKAFIATEVERYREQVRISGAIVD